MESIDMEGPFSIKEILVQLDGRFPMDDAVIEGTLLPWVNPPGPAVHADV